MDYSDIRNYTASSKEGSKRFFFLPEKEDLSVLPCLTPVPWEAPRR
jgi:hypothetical protein